MSRPIDEQEQPKHDMGLDIELKATGVKHEHRYTIDKFVCADCGADSTPAGGTDGRQHQRQEPRA